MLNTRDNKKFHLFLYGYGFVAVMCTILVLIVFSVKYKDTDYINYRNSDATWHTMLTIKAYDETPISVHKFLPIVSLGGKDDKGISWGETVNDKLGNYYYTSFSPAGYVLPFLFIKLFHLPISENSLYLFNAVLSIILVLLWSYFIYSLYYDNKYKSLVAVIGAITLLLMPEILHGMGIVYWHQAVMQVMLLAQILAYYKSNKSKIAKVVFYLICIINPYVEWTGYVANAGFMIVELCKQWKDNRWKAICLSEFIGFLTIISFGIFVLHYCTVIDANLFFEALKNRFFARNFRVSQPISELLLGYIDSFKYAWIVLMVLFIVTILIYKNFSWIKQTVLWKNKYLYVLFVFPVFENFIMKEHAISYSYDRMKFGFIIVLIICDLMSLILKKLEGKRLKYIAIFGLVLLDICNLNSYMYDKTYTWNALFRESNEILASELEKYRDDSVMGYPYSVRGYLNILYSRGIYEWTNIDCIENTAKQSNRQYAIMLVPATESEGNGWDMLGLEGAVVSDLYNDKISYIKVENNKCIEIDDTCIVTDLSDSNWNKGISIDGKTLLFNYSNVLLNVLMKSDKMICGNMEFNIQNVDFDKLWIKVTVDKDAKICKFPASVYIMYK